MSDMNFRTFPERSHPFNAANAEPGMGDINVMVKPSSLKNKTPMCLVNELARYNRIQHKYDTIKEEGPPHKKKFTVKLKLGEEEYEAEGSSKKKAEHEAAAIALRNTRYKHPPPKLLPNTKVNVTPTVQLNAIAMKRGEAPVYTTLNQPSSTYFQPNFPLNYYSRNVYQSRTMFTDYCYKEFNVMNGYSYGSTQFNALRYKCPMPYKVAVKVGEHEYIGEGTSMQMARHKAAKKALDDLLTFPEENNALYFNAETEEQMEQKEQTEDDFKSPISLVFEKAYKYNLVVNFSDGEGRGPPHMRIFRVDCQVGDQFKTSAEGNSKKIAKRKAAEKMLVLIQSLPPPPKPLISNLDKRRMKKKELLKKRPRILKNSTQEEQNGDSKYGDISPVTRLMEHHKKIYGTDPIYTFLDERGYGRRKQFSIAVAVNELKAIGTGPTKKEAKRKASEEMLKLLGLEMPAKEATTNLEVPTEKSIQNSSSGTIPVNGKQLAPGLLLVPNVNAASGQSDEPVQLPKVAESGFGKLTNGTQHFAYDIRPQAYASPKHKLFSGLNIQRNSAKEQLICLADSFGYEVRFSDFPKGQHHHEFLSLVTLNTNPPQTCYGSGNSCENAQNEAAFNALSMICEMGIDNLFTKKISTYIPEKEIVS